MTRRKRPTAADEVRAIISGGMGAVDAATRTWGGSRPGAGRKPTGQPVRETREEAEAFLRKWKIEVCR